MARIIPHELEGPPAPSRNDDTRNISVFGLILLVMLVITVFRILTRVGASSASTAFYVDLGSLFQKLSKAPTIPTSWISVLSTNYGETFPYGFQWLGEFIDFFMQIVSGIAFSSVAVSNAFVFLFYFLRWALL